MRGMGCMDLCRAACKAGLMGSETAHAGLTLMKPGPASEGVPSRMLFSGKLARIASPTARGFFGAPGCRSKTKP